MKISLNWIKEFVDIDDIGVDEIVKRFNLSTAEIEGVEFRGKDIDKVVFARIEKIEKHPNSDRLQIMRLNVGEPDYVQVLTTATNIYEGMVTCFVRDGGMVCGQKIKTAKMGGMESFGMGCSEFDLGIGSDNDGLADIKENVPLGADIKSYLPIDDVVFEIDNKTLSNRPDLWGHYGIAREIAAIFGRKLKTLDMVDLKKFSALPEIKVSVLDENCQRYSALKIENITRKVSPLSVKQKLCYCGLRDISFPTDLTNLLMLELGEPMHAFDANKVFGINVLKAKKGTTMTTLEGDVHQIPEGACVICDQNKTPVAVAGVKGGLNSGISNDTTSFLLESAVFEQSSIRKTSRSIGLVTDASLRYEKALDPSKTLDSISRLLWYLSEFDANAKVASSLSDVWNFKYPKISINVSCEFLCKRLGCEIETSKIMSILKALEFEVIEKNGMLSIIVPSFRATKDISIKEDIVEEVGRMVGYDNIKAHAKVGQMIPVMQSREHIAEYKTKRLLAEKYGVSEVHSYIWHYADFCKNHNIDTDAKLFLMDASRSGQSGIRSSLAPTLLKFFEENKNNISNLRICEIGRVISGTDKTDNTAIEEKRLCILFAGADEIQNVFELKKALDNVAKSVLNVNLSFDDGKTSPWLHPVNSCIVKAGDVVLGELGVLHPEVQMSFDKKQLVAIAELDFSALCDVDTLKQKQIEFSKYQSTKLSFNFLVPTEMKYSEFEKYLNMFHPKLICEFSLKDVYESETLMDKKSYTIEALISSAEKTLTSEDIERFSNKLISHFERLGITLKN